MITVSASQESDHPPTSQDAHRAADAALVCQQAEPDNGIWRVCLRRAVTACVACRRAFCAAHVSEGYCWRCRRSPESLRDHGEA
jgi:hypothetical protein